MRDTTCESQVVSKLAIADKQVNCRTRSVEHLDYYAEDPFVKRLDEEILFHLATLASSSLLVLSAHQLSFSFLRTL